MNSEFQGRLELTWTNKHKRLLARQDGTYQWVTPSDYRVAEVRLLQQVQQIGDNPTDNLLIEGDSLYALQSLSSMPEYSKKYVGKVKLAYIDPPFNTQQAFAQYDDALEHSVWLTMMRDRLIQIRTLLSNDGSVWVHCDDAEQHRLRCVLDEVFGPGNFVATVVWQKTLTRRNDAKRLSVAHDYLIIYAKDIENVRFNRLPSTAEQRATYKNMDKDPRGDWLPVPFHAPGIRKNLEYPLTLPSGRTIYPPTGRHWSTKEEDYLELLNDNLIYFGRDGDGMPQRKKFWVEEEQGLVPWTWWPYDEVGENREANKEAKAIAEYSGTTQPFDTPKPERLLQRILSLATNTDDIVLDCFVGSGTTAAVAHKLGRQWIAVEWSKDTIENYVIPRLKKVVGGEDKVGITETVGWEGGGGFQHVTVSESMFTEIGERVVLADWATNGKLSRATAAQLGFEYEDMPPFCGKKGKQRLAVIDGMVNADVIEILVQRVNEDETVVLCGTSVDPKARTTLRKLRPGSTIRKIPSALLSGFRYKAPIYETEQMIAATLENENEADA